MKLVKNGILSLVVLLLFNWVIVVVTISNLWIAETENTRNNFKYALELITVLARIPRNASLPRWYILSLFNSSILALIFMFCLIQVPFSTLPKMTKHSRLGLLSVMLDECWCWTVEKASLWDTYRLPRVSHWGIGGGCEGLSVKRRRNNETRSCSVSLPLSSSSSLSQMDNSGDACDRSWFRFWFMFFQS